MIMRKRARIIYNPTAGHETLSHKMMDILYILESAGYETSTFRTTITRNSAKNEATKSALNGNDLIIAAGGDGTVNQVVNGIAPLKKRPALGIIPAGTTNDFARALCLPRNSPIKAAKVIAKHQTFDMDVGKANRRYFINIAGGGLLTQLTYDVPSNLKTIFGYLAYLVKGAEMLPQIKPIKMDLSYDGGHFVGKASMFLLAMTNSIGGLEKIVPHASLDDGKFTLIIVKTSNLIQILNLLTKAVNGKSMNDSEVSFIQTNKLIAKPVNSPMEINLDGEYGGNAPMAFQNLQRHIKVFADLDRMSPKALTGKMTHQVDSRHEKETERKFIKKINHFSLWKK